MQDKLGRESRVLSARCTAASCCGVSARWVCSMPNCTSHQGARRWHEVPCFRCTGLVLLHKDTIKKQFNCNTAFNKLLVSKRPKEDHMKNLNTILKRTKRLYILCQLTWTLCVHYFICWVLLFSQVLVTSFSCSVDKVRLVLSKAA